MSERLTYARLLVLLTGICLGSPLTANANETEPGEQAVPSQVVAVADIKSCGDIRYSVGLAYLRERASLEGVKEVDVMVRVWSGLPAGSHAVHLHETAECHPCSAAGGHFDPGPNSNSNPDGNHPFHAGDLINLKVNEKGRGLLATVTSRVSLSDGPLSLFDADGSALIIHVQPDSYCPEGVVAGCAGGARAACGVVVRQQ